MVSCLNYYMLQDLVVGHQPNSQTTEFPTLWPLHGHQPVCALRPLERVDQ